MPRPQQLRAVLERPVAPVVLAAPEALCLQQVGARAPLQPARQAALQVERQQEPPAAREALREPAPEAEAVVGSLEQAREALRAAPKAAAVPAATRGLARVAPAQREGRWTGTPAWTVL